MDCHRFADVYVRSYCIRVCIVVGCVNLCTVIYFWDKRVIMFTPTRNYCETSGLSINDSSLWSLVNNTSHMNHSYAVLVHRHTDMEHAKALLRCLINDCWMSMFVIRSDMFSFDSPMCVIFQEKTVFMGRERCECVTPRSNLLHSTRMCSCAKHIQPPISKGYLIETTWHKCFVVSTCMCTWRTTLGP